MGLYFVRFECNLRVRLTTYKELQSAPSHIKHFAASHETQPSFVVYDLVKEECGLKIPNGLRLDASIKAENIGKAIQLCRFAAESIVDLITLTTQAEPAMVQLVLAYDASPNITARELVAENSLGPSVVSRPLYADGLQHIIEAMNVARAKTSDAEADRVERLDRAIRWLRKGVGENAILDEFTAYWVGLEVLDPVLKPVVRIFRTCRACGVPVDRCNHCGKEIMKSESTTNPLEGIRFIMVDKVGLDKKKFNTIRDLRGALLHGGKGLRDEELKLLTSCIPLFRRGLIRAICLELGINEGVAGVIAYPEPLRMHAFPRHRLREYVLIDPIPSLFEIDRQPCIELTVERTLLLSETKDNIEEKYSCSFKEINCKLVAEKGQIVEILSDPFSGIKAGG